MEIPFIDLRAQYESIKGDIESSIKAALGSFQFCKGKEVGLFEETFSRLLKVKHCISTGNGTDALFISLKALGIGPQDEVITPAFSWISSAEVITLCGAIPVFADVHDQTYTLDPKRVLEKITSKTKAVIAVHLYGQTAHLTELREICRQHNLYLIEDCAQSQLSEEHEKYAGTFGDAAAFSFYPTKNLGAFGDAGCIVTQHDALAEKMRRLANHGALEKDDHLIEGMNSRLDTIQAAVLLAKLPFLKKWNTQRSNHAQRYNKLLENVSQITTPYIRNNTSHSFHIYAIRATKRNELQQFLLNQGIQTIVHYPKALTNLPAFRYLNPEQVEFPVSNSLQKQVLSLPVYPELEEKSLVFITEKVKDFYKY